MQMDVFFVWKEREFQAITAIEIMACRRCGSLERARNGSASLSMASEILMTGCVCAAAGRGGVNWCARGVLIFRFDALRALFW